MFSLIIPMYNEEAILPATLKTQHASGIKAGRVFKKPEHFPRHRIICIYRSIHQHSKCQQLACGREWFCESQKLLRNAEKLVKLTIISWKLLIQVRLILQWIDLVM